MKIDESMALWRLAEALEIRHAALLMVELNPGNCKFSNPNRPEESAIYDERSNSNLSAEIVAQFRAVYHAMLKAIEREKLNVEWAREDDESLELLPIQRLMLKN